MFPNTSLYLPYYTQPQGTISESQIERWCNKYETGDTNLANEEERMKIK